MKEEWDKYIDELYHRTDKHIHNMELLSLSYIDNVLMQDKKPYIKANPITLAKMFVWICRTQKDMLMELALLSTMGVKTELLDYIRRLNIENQTYNLYGIDFPIDVSDSYPPDIFIIESDTRIDIFKIYTY